MAEAESKRCRGCGDTKSSSAFGRRVDSPDGLRTRCKECVARQMTAYRAANIAMVREKNRLYRANNPTIFAAQSARRSRKHAKRIAARRAAYRAANSAKMCAKYAAYRSANRDHVRAKSREWNRCNSEKRIAAATKRRARTMNAPGNGVTATQWRMVLGESLGICAYCNARRRLTMDHVNPLAVGGAHDVDNIAAACGRCNSSKGDATLVVWLARRRDACENNHASVACI